MSTISSWNSETHPSWTYDNMICNAPLHSGGGVPTPKPPTALPSSLYRKQNSSASSGLGSSEEIAYAPVMAESYFSNNLYGFDSHAAAASTSATAPHYTTFSTFRPPASVPPPLPAPSTTTSISSIATTMTTVSLNRTTPEYANQYCTTGSAVASCVLEEDEEDEGINTTPTMTPADDYSHQYGDQMESSTL